MVLDRALRRYVGAAIIGAAGLYWTGGVNAHEPPQRPQRGIELLTDATYDDAVACGEEGEGCATTPYRLCSDTLRAYEARLATPFSRVASKAAASKAKGRDMNERAWADANLWGVGIYVSPAPNPDAGAIQRVVLKKDDRTFEPLTTTVAPWPVKQSNGRQRRLTRGFFAFPIAAFAPTSPTTVVLTGLAGESSCTLTPERLAALR